MALIRKYKDQLLPVVIRRLPYSYPARIPTREGQRRSTRVGKTAHDHADGPGALFLLATQP